MLIRMGELYSKSLKFKFVQLWFIFIQNHPNVICSTKEPKMIDKIIYSSIYVAEWIFNATALDGPTRLAFQRSSQ